MYSTATFEIAPFGANYRADAEEIRTHWGARPHYLGGRGFGHGFGPRFGHRLGPGFGPRFGHGLGRGFGPRFGHGLGRGFGPRFGHGFGPGFGRGFRPGSRFGFRPRFGPPPPFGLPGVEAPTPVFDGGGPAVAAGAPVDGGGPVVGGGGPVFAAPGGAEPLEQIRWIRFMLNAVLGTSLPVDGVVSSDLRAALQNFQAQQGLPVSGFAGPDTIAALQAASASAAAPQPPAAAPAGELSALGEFGAQLRPASMTRPFSGDTMMHPANCNCPSCRNAAQAFEFETFQSRMPGGGLGEGEELELALELLNVRNDQEMEQFLGDVFNSIGRGLKSVGSFAAKNVLPIVGPALKQIAKTALPLAGGALGSLIPIPGVGTALGSALGGAVANALEMEVAGLSPADADIEKARRFVRLAGSAMHEAALAPASASPDAVARTALINAAKRHLPAAASAVAAMMPAPEQAPPSVASAPRGQWGTWRRHGNQIVVEGL